MENLESTMNEQIKELLLQADIQFDKDINEIDVCVLLPSDLEKFAELMVKETMQVVANCLPQNTYLDVADAVIEHFKE